MTTEINKPARILPPCPYEGCTSDSDHHWHAGPWDPWQICDGGSCQEGDEEYRCYSRPLRITQEDTSPPTPLMLSLPTVAKLVEAAMAEGYAAGSARVEAWPPHTPWAHPAPSDTKTF